MYLIVTHISIYVSGSRTFVDDGWYSDLLLAREFFAPHFGSIHVAGPRQAAEGEGNLKLHEVGPQDEGLRLHPSSVNAGTRARQFWLRDRRRWLRELEPLLKAATVVHGSVEDPFRPFMLSGLLRALELRKPVVLVGPDMDPWTTLDYQRAQMTRGQGYMHYARTVLGERFQAYVARRAAVTMLKEGSVYDRYARYAKNPKSFCHSMHRAAWVIGEQELDARLATLREPRPLRLVYAGRFTRYKGLLDALQIVDRCRELSANVTLDLIGSGEQRGELESRVEELRLRDRVRFLGHIPYGPEFLARLRGYDALLYTPVQEDTARLVYDAFASGLPTLGTDIPFVQCRARSDRAVVVWPIGDIQAGARCVANLDRDRDQLARLSLQARVAGVHHTVEHWYGLRTEWTRQIFEPQAPTIPLQPQDARARSAPTPEIDLSE